jgi:hypothetical protein
MDLQKKVIELESIIQNMKLKHREAARAHYRKKFKVTPDLYKENRIIAASYFWKSKPCRDTFPTVEYFD